MGYNELSEFMRSWGLVFLFASFIVCLGFALWPGHKKRFYEASQLPLRESKKEARK